MTIVYYGRREHGGGPNVVSRVDTDADANTVALDWRLDVRNHSPTGLEWGYGGSGPAQLALALCCDALDGDVRRAERIYQHVKWKLVGGFDRESWSVTKREVCEIIERIEQELRAEQPERFEEVGDIP